MRHTWTVGPESQGVRLDQFLAAHLPALSRSQVAKRLKDGAGTVNGETATVHQFLRDGEQVVLEDADTRIVEDLPPPILNIVGEGPDWAVLDKPAGVVVHPDTIHRSGTLVDALLKHFPDMAKVGEDPSRPGIVHRLDKEVSGLMVVAKTAKGYESLKRQFAAHTVDKRYLALVQGEVTADHGELKFRIARSTDGTRMAARPEHEAEGKAAWTHYGVLRRIRGATLLELAIFSGRTHQIRAHLFAFGHPVIGDPLYRPRVPEKRTAGAPLLLQSAHLAFDDPATGERRNFDLAPLPAFRKVAETLGMTPAPTPIFVLTGPSGAGKTTVVHALNGRNDLPLSSVVSQTTRSPRPGETDGKDYRFVTKDAFERTFAQDGFFEAIEAYGHHYGLAKEDVAAAEAKGHPLLLTIDLHGVRALRRAQLPIYVIYLDAPEAQLRNRLERRHMAPADLERRLSRLPEELAARAEADAVVPSLDGQETAAIEASAAAIRRRLALELPPLDPKGKKD